MGRPSLEKLSALVVSLLRCHAIKSMLQDSAASRRNGETDFFGQLFAAQQDAFIGKLQEVTLAEGEVAMEASSRSFVLVAEGEAGVLTDAARAKADGSGASFRENATEVLAPGVAHGGKALLTGAAVQECIVALSAVRLYRISHSDVEEALGGTLSEVLRLNEIKKVLADVFLFKTLPEDQIEKMVHAMQRQRFEAGETIVQQGDNAHHFFLIQSGMVKVVKDGSNVRSLGRWDFFGERGLLLQDKRSATCRAESGVTCLMLEADAFKEIVGIFRRDLEHRMYLQDLDITIHDLELRAVVGRGTFGIVKLVHHHKDTSKVYALKCVDKRQVVKQHQERALVMEREIHAQCYHPCIVQFIKTFQDRDMVYFLTEFLGGGDLFFAIREICNLSKDMVQFYSGSIVLALEYLHGRGIMYRDLKPENVLLDWDGNAKLVDFGSCKKALRASTLVGTPEYLAPEVILGKGYTGAVDWWALGVMMHEFVVGPLPFGKDTDDQLELFREILEAPLDFPEQVDDDTAIAIISGLLERGPENRVGSNARGAKEIQEHRYFAITDFDWRALLGHYLAPPWVPSRAAIEESWETFGAGQKLVDSSAQEDVKALCCEKGMEWAAVF